MLSTNQVGSVQLVTDASSGDVVQRIEYDEFGRVLVDSAPGLQPFGFAGGLYEFETKLVRFGARDYSADVGRWLADDAIRFKSGPNAYTYADCDPVDRIDPHGFFQLDTTPSGNCKFIVKLDYPASSSRCWWNLFNCQDVCELRRKIRRLKCDEQDDKEPERPKDDDDYGPCDYTNECYACGGGSSGTTDGY